MDEIERRKSAAPPNNYTYSSKRNLGSATLIASVTADVDLPPHATVDDEQRLVKVTAAAPHISNSGAVSAAPKDVDHLTSTELRVLWLDKADAQTPAVRGWDQRRVFGKSPWHFQPTARLSPRPPRLGDYC
ncbi:MAG: hypothetical protein V9H26_10830 [Verrucomicrobiota bacterium]